MVGRLRQVWPDIQIHVRGDCGFGLLLMYESCEKPGVFYTFVLSMNTRLKAASEELLAQAELQFKETGQKQRLFMSMGYQAEDLGLPSNSVSQSRVACRRHEPSSGGEQSAGCMAIS
jgi:hypothetical protein